MDNLLAFSIGLQNRNNEEMVFDWEKAARLIKERSPNSAAAGLRSDWEYTGSEIYADGKILEDKSPYLASTWAVPELDLDGEIIPCFKMQSETPNWHAKTYWPDEARKILVNIPPRFIKNI